MQVLACCNRPQGFSCDISWGFSLFHGGSSGCIERDEEMEHTAQVGLTREVLIHLDAETNPPWPIFGRSVIEAVASEQ